MNYGYGYSETTINSPELPQASRYDAMKDANLRLIDEIKRLKEENIMLRKELEAVYAESEAFYNAACEVFK